jgi:hypothetical protein
MSAISAPSPSDMVGPSPVTSNGTATTDIEDDVSEGIEEEEQTPEPPKPVETPVRSTPPHYIGITADLLNS